ncbi:hypothetical protein EJD97_022084 [Solanum chilense]|uniref:Uncharacterized protein n=1 Tax=Solanum chilense TaxID=4083 RepID=A0A6N2C6U7_SOLCI|nr:hypothetical protein EJD97_022084 [Solanum chilense]
MDFSDRDAPYPYLEILENKQHSRAKVLTLKVYPPMIGTFPFHRKTLNTNHISEWSSTKTKDVNFSGNITIDKFLVLKSCTHQNVVVVVPHRLDEHLSSWRDPSSRFGAIAIRLTIGSE